MKLCYGDRPTSKETKPRQTLGIAPFTSSATTGLENSHELRRLLQEALWVRFGPIMRRTGLSFRCVTTTIKISRLKAPHILSLIQQSCRRLTIQNGTRLCFDSFGFKGSQSCDQGWVRHEFMAQGLRGSGFSCYPHPEHSGAPQQPDETRNRCQLQMLLLHMVRTSG